MSDAKWTPGPWRVEQDTTLVWGNCTFGDDGVVERLGIPVADMCGNPSWSRDTVIDWETRAANARLTSAAPALYEAAQAHRAWSYAEKHGLGSFDQRMALCSHAESLTLRAMAQADGEPEPAYKGTVGMTIWPHVELTETEESEGRALVALCLEHERAARSNKEG